MTADPLDAEIDALYALPPAEFTAARNALAKRAGPRAAEIRKLARPSAAAWAINQLYWQRRDVFDRLAAAARALRAAHARRLAGRDADLAAADETHREALDAAVETARGFLASASGDVAHATVAAIHQTLQAVPSDQVQGRLTRPLEAAGFSILAGLASDSHARGPAEVVSITRGARAGKASGADTSAAPRSPVTPGRADDRARDAKAEARRAATEQRRAEAERRKARAVVERQLRAAVERERQATAALAAARHTVERADRQIDRLEEQLRAARAAAGDRREDVERARGTLNDAAAERIRLERRLQEL